MVERVQQEPVVTHWTVGGGGDVESKRWGGGGT
jgi:hypothetical protein